MPERNPGTGSDEVLLELAGKPLKIFTSYTIRKSIFTQPAQFNFQLGYGELKRTGQLTRDLIKLVTPNTPFKLYVGGHLQQTGHIDGYVAGGLATELQVHGRDNMALLHDAYVINNFAAQNDTYKSLTQKVLDLLGIKDKLVTSDEANAKITMGHGIPGWIDRNTIDEIEPVSDEPTNKNVRRSINAYVAETFYQFLQRQYHRAGLFLWAAGDGSFVLSEPNSVQSPSYRIVRRRGQIKNAVSVERHFFRNDITTRYTSAHVYGRAPGAKHGRGVEVGQFVDPTMFNIYFNDVDAKPISFRDVAVSTRAQAEFYARRKLAEFNRASWHFEYTVTGHSVPNIQSGQPVIWTPNTMVEVDDDELGLKGNYYLEEVSFKRAPTETTLTLMDPTHLIFGSDDDEP